MKKIFGLLVILPLLQSCKKSEELGRGTYDNPEIAVTIPEGFPVFNSAANRNKPTQYGVQLGKVLFNEKRFSIDNSISCASCHNRPNAFSDDKA